MPTDVLILGPVVFTDFAPPERMPFGGKQQTVVHKMPGGFRTVDCMGPDDDDRKWRGILWGDTAYDDMLLLDQLRVAGTELPFSWGAESRLAIIEDFKAEVEKQTCIHYDISLILSDDSGGGGLLGALSSITSLVSADLGAAIGL